MKSSKSTSAEPPTLPTGNRRSQPPRLTRNNVSRSTASGARGQGTKASLGTTSEQVPAIKIFPAITHFADAISALPKELVRHFTLLKEVDAKIFMPEEELTRLVSDALNAPLPSCSRTVGAKSQKAFESAQISLQSNPNISMTNGFGDSTHSTSDVDAVWDSANFNRRQLFNRCALTMQGMLVSLDEKNHVISTAGEALAKQLARIDDCLPFIELEVSEEARNGSLTHWAYPENRTPKLANSVTTRKEQPVRQTSAVVQQSAEDSLLRNDSRKQNPDKRRNRNQNFDSELNEPIDIKRKDRKFPGNAKLRKATFTSGGAKIDITHGSNSSNGNSVKRRKVEKTSINSITTDRSTNSSSNSIPTVSKGRRASPGSTPQSENSRKRSRAVPPSSNGSISKKRSNIVTSVLLSPSLKSSPISSTVSEMKKADNTPPPPVPPSIANSGKQPSTRCRQNSILANHEKQHPFPSKNKPNDNTMTDLSINAALNDFSIKTGFESSFREDSTNQVGEKKLNTSDQVESNLISEAALSSKIEISVGQDTSETYQDITSAQQTSISIATKIGRTIKPSTSAISLLPDPVRPRGIRTPLELLNGKRNQKRYTGINIQAPATQYTLVENGEKEITDEDDLENDVDEQRYCYCNNVSYGEMVACDADGCKREWFHLDCVGLKTAPKAKWYCEDCKESTKGKRFNNSR